MIEIQAADAANLVQLLTLTPREIAKATARGINRATAAGRRAAQGYLPTAFPGAKPRAAATPQQHEPVKIALAIVALPPSTAHRNN